METIKRIDIDPEKHIVVERQIYRTLLNATKFMAENIHREHHYHGKKTFQECSKEVCLTAKKFISQAEMPS